jgi:hypothetical protein
LGNLLEHLEHLIVVLDPEHAPSVGEGAAEEAQQAGADGAQDIHAGDRLDVGEALAVDHRHLRQIEGAEAEVR